MLVLTKIFLIVFPSSTIIKLIIRTIIIIIIIIIDRVFENLERVLEKLDRVFKKHGRVFVLQYGPCCPNQPRYYFTCALLVKKLH